MIYHILITAFFFVSNAFSANGMTVLCDYTKNDNGDKCANDEKQTDDNEKQKKCNKTSKILLQNKKKQDYQQNPKSSSKPNYRYNFDNALKVKTSPPPIQPSQQQDDYIINCFKPNPYIRQKKKQESMKKINQIANTKTTMSDKELESTLKCIDNGPHSQASMCEKIICQEEIRLQLPKNILLAIAEVESGKDSHPWPWTINHRGRGMFFKNKVEMLKKVCQIIATGDRNIDIGCMQLNIFYHGKNFKSVNEMADPRKNIAYAGKMIKDFKEKYGSWVLAIKYYHSRLDKYNKRYCHAVKCKWLRNLQKNLHDVSLNKIKAQNIELAKSRIINNKCNSLHKKAQNSIKVKSFLDVKYGSDRAINPMKIHNDLSSW